MVLSSLLNAGTEEQHLIQALKIKLTNIISLFTVAIAGLYSLNYLFVLNESFVGYTNLLFAVAYSLPIVLNKFARVTLAKITFFVLLMLHLLVCTNVYVTNETGFHLYYFLVPTGAFLLFENKQVTVKILLSVIALLLFFVCENNLNPNPLIQLSDDMNRGLYQSVVFVNMVEVVIVMTLFVKQIENNEQQLNYLATTDALTGIANRHHFFSVSEQLLTNAKSKQTPFTLALIDLDHFKHLNDEHGHLFGDICLKSVASVIAHDLRNTDVLARYGGEEFIIAMPNTTAEEANNVIDRIRRQVEDLSIQENESTASCTISAGLAELTSLNDNMKQLILYADQALYAAKLNGRNRIERATDKRIH